MNNKFKIGDKVIAKRTLHYFMGQIPSDKICRGEECTIDYIDEKWKRLGFEEHADRYGPWPMEAFKISKKQ